MTQIEMVIEDVRYVNFNVGGPPQVGGTHTRHMAEFRSLCNLVSTVSKALCTTGPRRSQDTMEGTQAKGSMCSQKMLEDSAQKQISRF